MLRREIEEIKANGEYEPTTTASTRASGVDSEGGRETVSTTWRKKQVDPEAEDGGGAGGPKWNPHGGGPDLYSEWVNYTKEAAKKAATQSTDLINITPREAITRTFVPPGAAALIGIILGAIVLLPGAVLAAGVYAWFTRRRRG